MRERGRHWGLVLFLSAIVFGCSTTSGGPAPDAPEPGGSPPVDAGVAAPALPERVQAIVNGLRALLECPERAWANDDWSKRPILLVDASQKEAFLWNDQANKGTTRAVPFGTLPKQVSDDFYFDVVDYEGVRTLALSLDFTAFLNSRAPSRYADFATLIAIHEGFHIWTQASWSVAKPDTTEMSERDPNYPEVWRLRYLRSQVLVAMRASLQSGEPLGNAAFWNQALHTEYLSEMKSLADFDVLEGSAQFAETTATILGKLGCSVDDGAIADELTANAATFVSPSAKRLQAGGEPYDLGLFALLLFRKNGASGYEAKIAAGQPPVDALLDGVVPIAQKEDPAVVEAAKTTIEQRNAAAAAWIEPLLARFKAPSAKRIAVPSSWVVGAFSIDGAYYAANEPGRPHVMRSMSATLHDPASAVKLTLAGTDIVEEVGNPCGKKMMIITTDAADVTLSAGKTKLDAKTTKLDVKGLPVHAMTDPAGLEWLCAGAI